jgi:hypothetical protein
VDEKFELLVEGLRVSSVLHRARRSGRLPRAALNAPGAGVAEGGVGGSGSVMVTVEKVSGWRADGVERMPGKDSLTLPPHGWATYLVRCFDLATSSEHLLLVGAPPAPWPRSVSEAREAQRHADERYPGVLSLAGRVPSSLLQPSAATSLARVLSEHLVGFRSHESVDEPHGNPALPVPAHCTRGGLSLHTYALGPVFDAAPALAEDGDAEAEDEDEVDDQERGEATRRGAGKPDAAAGDAAFARPGLGNAEAATSPAFLEAVEQLSTVTLVRTMREASDLGAERGKLSVTVGRVDEFTHGDVTFGGALPGPGLRLPSTQRVFLAHVLEARSMHEFAGLFSVELAEQCAHKPADFPAVHFIHFADRAASDIALAQQIADRIVLDLPSRPLHSKRLALWGGLTIRGATIFIP